MTPTTEILAIVGCLVASAFFSGSETALLRMRGYQMDADIDSPHALSALAAKRLVGSTGELLVTILLGNNVTNIFAAAIASALAVRALGEEGGVIVSTIILTVVVLIFCEVIPKAVAARNPRRVSYSVALPLYLVHRLASPIHWVFHRWLDPLVRRIAGRPEEEGNAEEVLELARRLCSEGRPGSAARLLGRVASAVDRTVGEVMTPRPEVFAVPLETAAESLLERMLTDRYTRVLVFRGSIDSVEGFVHFKDLVTLERSGDRDLSTIIKPVARVPESKPILDILAVMQRDAAPLAVVKDEFGITVGLVTQEDVLEEFVGEIRDEFDGAELQHIRQVTGEQFVARGSTSVLDFNRRSGWAVTATAGETLGGLVFDALGSAPERGDRVVVEDYEVIVTACQGTYIQEVSVHRQPDEAGAVTGEAGAVTGEADSSE
jgi:putative hemolysin